VVSEQAVVGSTQKEVLAVSLLHWYMQSLFAQALAMRIFVCLCLLMAALVHL
jgi:hypothetical protein